MGLKAKTACCKGGGLLCLEGCCGWMGDIEDGMLWGVPCLEGCCGWVGKSQDGVVVAWVCRTIKSDVPLLVQHA